MSRSNGFFISLSVAALLLTACNPLKKAGKEDYLLVKNKVVQEGKYKAKDDIDKYILTKPNKKLLSVWRLRLQIHNLVNEDKMYARRSYLDSVREAKNAARIAEGKKPRLKQRNTLAERFYQFGEPPALYKETETKLSVDNIKLFLFNKGYFHGEVRDSTVLKGDRHFKTATGHDSTGLGKNRRAKVFYIVNRNQPFLLKDIKIEVADERLKTLTKNYTKFTILKPGDRFDLDKLEEDRSRLTRYLRRKGYYFFNKEYIEFVADTAAGDHQVNLTMAIVDPDFNVKVGDSLVTIHEHRPAQIRNIYVDADYSPGNVIPFTDSVDYGGFHFPYRERMRIKPQIVAKQIILESGNYYNTDDNDVTYRNLSNLRSFRNISIEYIYVGSENGRDILDCKLNLTLAQKQSFGVDFQGTTTGTYPGIETNFSYKNRNAFMGAESFEFKVYARAESQRVGNDQTQFNVQNLFNTLEVGNEISIRVPKFLLPFRSLTYSKRNSPFTNIRVNNAYQTRPDYNRFLSTFSFGYEWQETAQKFHRYTPLEFSVIRVQKSNSFEELIAQSNDLFLRNSFSDHILFHNVYSYSYSNFVENKNGKYFSFRGNAQLGGNLLYLVALASKFQKDQLGRYTILNTPFAQFFRVEPDFRGYIVLNKTNTFAFRGTFGIGVPYLNSTSMPFEKSFFAGGATDMRGWRSRRLGPGSYHQNTNFLFDQFADLKLLMQAEYRLTLIKQIELGFFADAGNIWLINPDPSRPGAEFDVKRFYKEIALGAGVGLRINLGFFIFRVDPGIPLYDPTTVPSSNGWVVRYLKWKSVVWNFAINYPF